MIWALVAILAIVLVVLVVFIVRSKKKEEQRQAMEPVEDLASLTVAHARRGDAVTVLAKGDEFDDLSFTVDRVYHYESGGDRWFELSGKYRGRRVFLEVYRDDELEVTLNAARDELNLADLGLDENKLIEFDEKQDRSSQFDFQGAQWRYECSEEIVCFEDDSKEGEGYYGWDFEEVGGDRVLYVEKYEGEPFEVGIGQSVHPDDVRVFRA